MIDNKDIKKFSVDKEYFFMFYSNEFVLENEEGYSFTVRWEYENHSKFSNYEKPFTEDGKRANFTLSLTYKTTSVSALNPHQCKEVWLTVSGRCGDVSYNFATKKDMLEHLDQMMGEFSGEKEKFYNFDYYKIKKRGE